MVIPHDELLIITKNARFGNIGPKLNLRRFRSKILYIMRELFFLYIQYAYTLFCEI